MSKLCPVTGRKPQSGNKVSHANNKTRRRFEPNLQEHCFYVPTTGRYVKLRVSTRAMRTIDKLGIETVLQQMQFADKNKKKVVNHGR